MPVTASRHRRREATEDIEEPSTQEHVEDVEEEEEPSQPRRGKARQAEAQEGDDDDLGLFTNPPDQPLEKQQAMKIHGLAEDWGQINRGIHKTSYGLVSDVAAAMAEFTEGEKADKNIGEIDRMMKKLIDTENELRAHEDTLSELYQRVVRGEAISSIVSRYDEDAKRRVDEYKQKTSRQRYAKHDDYSSFRQAIFEVQNPDEAMPPITDLIPPEDGDESDDDEDIQVGGVTQDYRCPLTLVLLQDPLTSTECGHSFQASAIREFLKHSRTAREKCPTSGCNAIISMDKLKPNKELAKKAKDAARRERMREEDNDEDGDVIE